MRFQVAFMLYLAAIGSPDFAPFLFCLFSWSYLQMLVLVKGCLFWWVGNSLTITIIVWNPDNKWESYSWISLKFLLLVLAHSCFCCTLSIGLIRDLIMNFEYCVYLAPKRKNKGFIMSMSSRLCFYLVLVVNSINKTLPDMPIRYMLVDFDCSQMLIFIMGRGRKVMGSDIGKLLLWFPWLSYAYDIVYLMCE